MPQASGVVVVVVAVRRCIVNARTGKWGCGWRSPQFKPPLSSQVCHKHRFYFAFSKAQTHSRLNKLGKQLKEQKAAEAKSAQATTLYAEEKFIRFDGDVCVCVCVCSRKVLHDRRTKESTCATGIPLICVHPYISLAPASDCGNVKKKLQNLKIRSEWHWRNIKHKFALHGCILPWLGVQKFDVVCYRANHIYN